MLANLPANRALAMLPDILRTYQTNDAQVLTEIRSLVPGANLYLFGYYNPFLGDPTNNPAKPIFAQGGPQVNSIIQSLATQFNTFTSIPTRPFWDGKAPCHTFSQYPAGSTSPAPGSSIEPIGNVHPNNAGYTVIANQVASTPEPASLGPVGMAAIGFGIVGRFEQKLKRYGQS